MNREIETMKAEEELKPTGDGARSERQEPGDLRELDAEIAERVMGWKRNPNYKNIHVPILDMAFEWYAAGEYGSNDLPHYSTDIAAAMQVVEHLCPTQQEYNAGRKSCRFIMRQQDSGLWNVEARSPFLTSYSRPMFADSKSLPEAICRAALSLVDGTTEERNDE